MNRRQIVGVLAWLALGGLTLQAQPKVTKTEPLERPTTVKWENISLEDVVADLRENHQFDVTVDRQSIENEGLVTSDLKVRLDLRGITLRSILWLALDAYRLELIEKEGSYLITSRPVAEATFIDRTYDLKPLGSHFKDPQAIVDLVKASVTGFWNDSDGYGGTVEVEGKSLKVKQTTSTHEQIADLFRQIERELAVKKTPLSQREINENQWRTGLAAKANQKLKIEGEQPLQAIITECSRAYGIFFWMDGAGMSDAQITLTTPVQPEIKGTTVSEVLDSILHPLDLGYVIDHEAVLITSRIKAELPNRLRVFNTRSKTSKVKSTPEQLIAEFQDSEKFGTWGDGGGSIVALGPLLIIRQSPAALNEINKRLNPK